MLVSEISSYISENTRDINLVTWTDVDIRDYINEAIEAIVIRAPQASSKKELVACVAGVEQVLANEAVEIINVISNDSLGPIIHQTDVIQKDAFVPNWKQATPSAIVKEWMKRSEPTSFLVSPPLDAARNLLVEFSFFPVDVVAPTDVIPIQNQYLQALRYFCMYKVFSRDSESTPTNQTSELFFQKYEKEFITE